MDSMSIGDKLFKSGGYLEDAIIEQPFFGGKWDLYADGYKKAADIVVEKRENPPFDNDALIYPVCFLYRQYIELKLKEIILYGSRLIDEPKDISHKDKTAHHKINFLWKYNVRPILEKVYKDDPKETLDAAESYIMQFIEYEEETENFGLNKIMIDPNSFAFRYPVDKNGNPTLEGVERISLDNLKNKMNKLSSFLEGCTFGIHTYLEYKSEMEAEYKNYY